MTMGFLLPHSPQAISDPCRIPHRSEQHQSGKTNPRHLSFNWNLNFSRKSGELGSRTGLDPLVQPQKTHPNLSQQSEDISIHHLHPTTLGNDLRTTGSRLNLHFTSKKKEGEVHTWGENGVNNNYLKAGFHLSDPQLPPVLGPAGSPGSHPRFDSTTRTGITGTLGSWGWMEAVRSYTGWVCRTQLLV